MKPLTYDLIKGKTISGDLNSTKVTVIEGCRGDYMWWEETKNNQKLMNLQLLDLENKKEEIKRGVIYYDGTNMLIKDFSSVISGLVSNTLIISDCDYSDLYDTRKKIYPQSKDVDFAEDNNTYWTNIASSLGWYPWVIFYALEPANDVTITFYNNDNNVSCNTITTSFEAMKAYCFKYDTKSEKFIADETIPIKTKITE